jgi:biotin carboxyl carrier protein
MTPTHQAADAATPSGVGLADASTTHEHTLLAEDLRVPERLIAAPAAGVFNVLATDTLTDEDTTVELQVGQTLGAIERNAGTVPVVSPHTGFLMGLLALPGERVRDGQPLAWVRVIS